jgi:hypothetical protein
MEEAKSLPWLKLPGSVLDLVRNSCAELLESTQLVTIDDAALSAYVRTLDASKLQRPKKRQYPLNFPTPRSEINFLCTLALLQIGSGWRVPLHAQRGGKGAAETMTFGCMGLHISGEISASVMTTITLFEVAQIFGLKIQEEYEIARGIRSERKTELYSLAEAIHKLLRDTGSMLRNLACEDWADYWAKHGGAARVQVLSPVTGEPIAPPLAEDAVAKLVKYFTGLQDAYVLPPAKSRRAGDAAAESQGAAEGAAAPVAASASVSVSPAAPAVAASLAVSAVASPRVVYLLKKAQLMVAELFLRFGVSSGAHATYCFCERLILRVFMRE